MRYLKITNGKKIFYIQDSSQLDNIKNLNEKDGVETETNLEQGVVQECSCPLSDLVKCQYSNQEV